ncbi:MAG TPA: translocation/assembly module TamB domain-containing protein, partial [Zeimonas sp.]|nr:translocation/assembly module TamB domain-containing protein [Zeimonas sp.]
AWPDPRLRTRLVVDRGVLDGQPLRADLRGEVSRRRVADAALELAFGDLHASARGSLGRAGDRLQFTLRAASLARFDRRLEGSLAASGELAGGAGDLFDATAWQAFGVVADVDGQRLRWDDTLRVGALSGRIELPELRAGRVAVRIDAEGLQVAGTPLDRARLRLDGDADAHALQLDASGPQVSARASARGALSTAGAVGWRWQGTVDEFDADAPLSIRLAGPARLVADGDGIALGSASLRVDGGELRVAALSWYGGRIETRGEASGLPIARWAERFAGPQALAGVEGQLQDLRLQGSWDLAGSSPQTPSGRVALRLDAGDTVDSRGEAELVLDEGRLDGSIDLRVPTLAFANRLIGPEWAVAGRLRFAGTVGGTIARPRLEGELTGRDLALLQRALGWRLTDGTLDARFDGDRLDLKMLRLESGGGSIAMSGQLLLDGMHGGFTLRADRLPVPIGPGQRVVVSGNTGVASSGTSLEWKGDIRADEGLIELRGGEAPSMPDDVVIVDRQAAGEPAGTAGGSPASGFRIGADLDLDLGDKLRVRGSGIDVVLAGTLNLRGTLPAAPRAFGMVRVLRGTYTAYGQRLEIERGQVVFNGPLDNPVLDIVAMRRNQAVEAGVALSGTVLSPRLRLVSTPDVPDSQKLSWLVLGVGLEDVNTAGQGAALQAAAATLFGSNDGGLSGGVAGALGLDILTVRGAGAGSVFDPNFGASFPGQSTTGGAPVGTATQNVVAIGKRLSSRVFVTYEQGLRGVWNLLRIQYDITNRLSIRAQAGTDSAVDVLYFWSFD